MSPFLATYCGPAQQRSAVRPAKDRRAAPQTVVAALSRVNDTVESVTPLRSTVGDGFQGVYAHLGQALWAAFLLRVDLAPDIDVRFGIARGKVKDLDVERGSGRGELPSHPLNNVRQIDLDGSAHDLRVHRHVAVSYAVTHGPHKWLFVPDCGVSTTRRAAG